MRCSSSPGTATSVPQGARSSTRSRRSGATASRAVLFSGMAFVLAMCGLLLIPDSVLRSLGVGAITVGLVSVLGALTLVPALLSLLGDRVNALADPVPRPRGRRRRPGGPVLGRRSPAP